MLLLKFIILSGLTSAVKSIGPETEDFNPAIIATLFQSNDSFNEPIDSLKQGRKFVISLAESIVKKDKAIEKLNRYVSTIDMKIEQTLTPVVNMPDVIDNLSDLSLSTDSSVDTFSYSD